MKKKFALVLLVTLTMTSVLTGCNMPFELPFGKPDGDTEVDQPVEDMTPAYLTANEGLTYEEGVTITATELVTVAPEKAGEITQTVVMNSDGTVASDFIAEGEGSALKTVIVEFIDGTSESIDVMFTVVKKDILSLLSTELQDSLKNSEWTTISIPVENSDRVYAASNSNSIDMLVNSTLFDNESYTVDSTGLTWVGTGLSKSDEEMLAGEGESPLRNAVILDRDVELTKVMLSTSEEEISEEDLTLIDTYCEYLKQLYHEIVTVTTAVTEKVVYDAEGVSYPVKVVNYTIDGTPYGKSSVQCPVMYYIDYTEEDRVILMDYATGVSDIVYNEEESTEAIYKSVKDVSYEDFKTVTVVEDSFWDVLFTKYSATTDSLNTLVSNFMFGDATQLISAEEPTVEPEGEPVTLPDLDEEQTVVVDTPEEEAAQTNEAAVKRTTYAQQFPEVFAWTNGLNPDTYRRWYYTLTEDTEFVGTIRKPDGTVIEGDAEFSDGFRYDMGTGKETNTNDYRQDGTKIQTYTITTAYANYEITTANTTRILEFKPSESTSGRLVFTYDNNKFYIETIRSNEISDWMKTCKYPVTGFANKEFSVTEGTSNDTVTTEYGKIIPYTIKYKNLKESAISEEYMAIYNMNNDYLVCYADNLTGTNDLFTVLLKELVVKK